MMAGVKSLDSDGEMHIFDTHFLQALEKSRAASEWISNDDGQVQQGLPNHRRPFSK